MARNKAFAVEAGWQVVLKKLGIDPTDLLKRAQLPEELFRQKSPMLSTKDYFRLWACMEELVDEPAFPIRLIEHLSVEAFSPPMFAALCSQNLVAACKRISTYKKLMAPVALRVEESEYELTLTLEWLDALSDPPQSLAIAEVMFFIQLGRLGTREWVVPTKMILPTPPSALESDLYRAFLGVDVERGKGYQVTFSMRDATRPFLTANEAMWEIFEPNFRKRLLELEATTPTKERVRAVLLEALPGGYCNIDEVSRRLAMGKRTLQRRLREEETSFQSILDQTREELARHYLQETSLSSTEISFLLGFEEPNSFYRAFHNWTGHTPDQMRRQDVQ